MSLESIHTYLSEVENLAAFGGTTKETALRNAFYTLLNDYARQHGLLTAIITYERPEVRNFRQVCTVSMETVEITGEMEDVLNEYL